MSEFGPNDFYRKHTIHSFVPWYRTKKRYTLVPGTGVIFPGLDLYSYTDPARHLIAAGWDLDELQMIDCSSVIRPTCGVFR